MGCMKNEICTGRFMPRVADQMYMYKILAHRDDFKRVWF